MPKGSRAIDADGYCLSNESKGWDWQQRGSHATCALCGKTVRVTRTGAPYRHKP